MQWYLKLVYGLIIIWTLVSIILIVRLWIKKDVKKVNPYIFDSIPTMFTTLGILGTFTGIYFGLLNFDVNEINSSIPQLLEGLKTAFLTSIFGVSLSILFGKTSQFVLRSVEKNSPTQATGELAALNEIIAVLEGGRKDSNTKLELLNKSLIGEGDESLATQIIKLRNQFKDLESKFDKQNPTLEKIQAALGGDGETSLLTQLQKLRTEQGDYAKDAKGNIDLIVASMKSNHQLLGEKFDEFSKLMAKNNTEALVKVMENATAEFNKQMSAIVETLVKENFQELNNSVARLNDWQMENKEMVAALIEQFKQVSNEFALTSKSIENITQNTSKLTDENSHLTKLIEELQKVLIDDTRFQQIVEKVVSAVDTLKQNTEAFDNTTEKLNQWVRNQMSFSDSVAALLIRLEEIDKIKDINEVFWSNTKKQLEEGVGLIERASKTLSNDLENINAEFYERLNDTLQNLDTLIQRIITNYN